MCGRWCGWLRRDSYEWHCFDTKTLTEKVNQLMCLCTTSEDCIFFVSLNKSQHVNTQHGFSSVLVHFTASYFIYHWDIIAIPHPKPFKVLLPFYMVKQHTSEELCSQSILTSVAPYIFPSLYLCQLNCILATASTFVSTIFVSILIFSLLFILV